MRGLTALGRIATRALPVGVLIGLVFPDLAAATRPFFAPAIFAMLTLALVRIDIGRAVAWAKRPLPILAIGLWLMLICPLGVALAVGAAGTAIDPSLAAAIVLYAASPPILSSVGLALLLRLDSALSVVVLLTTTLVSPLTVPPLVLWLAGVDLPIGALALTGRLALFVGAAGLVAFAIRKGLGPRRLTEWGTGIDGVMVIFLLLFACSIMDGVTDLILAEPGRIGATIALAFALNIGLQIVGAPLALLWHPTPGTTVAMMTGNKNMGLLIASLGGAVDPTIFLFFALVQLPIYILPAALEPAYRRLAKLPPRTPRPP